MSPHGLWGLIQNFVEKLTSASGPPDMLTTLSGFLLAALLVSSPQAWKPLRHVITVVHEIGHATAGLLTGNKPSGFRFHADTSGVTEAQMRRGVLHAPGRLLTILAGYPFPAAVGALSVWALANGWAGVPMLAFSLALIVCLPLVRNLHGFALIGALNLVAWLSLFYLPIEALGFVSAAFLSLMLLGGVRTVAELAQMHLRGEKEGSDVQVASRWFPPAEPLIFALFFACYGGGFAFAVVKLL